MNPPTGEQAATAALTDGQVAAVTDGLHQGELEQAKLARSKSKDERVVSFARMMIEHHGRAQKRLAALKETPEQSPLGIQLQNESQQTLAQLQQASGADFDRAYLDAQVQGHARALDALEQRLLPSAKAPELTKYLRGLQPTIERHLARARSLRSGLALNTPRAEEGTTEPASLRQDTPAPSPHSN